MTIETDTACGRLSRARHLAILGNPSRWPTWPLLPLARHRPGEEPECGLLYDAFGVNGRTGFSATVIHANLFMLPPTEAEFLALPRSVFDTLEELLDAGWVVD